MNELPLLNSKFFIWIIIPFLIFFARILDVTLQTIRIMFLARGQKVLAPLLGFFEVLIWLLAIRQIMQNLDNVFCYIAYASGFAMGNWIGLYLEEKLAYGTVILRLITHHDANELVQSLRRKGFGVTKMDALGSQGAVNVIYTILKRQDLQRVIHTINQFNPKAFYSIEDTRMVKEGIFPLRKQFLHHRVLNPYRFMKKIKIYQKRRPLRKGK